MGTVLTTYVPIIKGSNGIIAVETTEQNSGVHKCGRCVDVCPMELRPCIMQIRRVSKNWAGMKEEISWIVSNADAAITFVHQMVS